MPKNQILSFPDMFSNNTYIWTLCQYNAYVFGPAILHVAYWFQIYPCSQWLLPTLSSLLVFPCGDIFCKGFSCPSNDTNRPGNSFFSRTKNSYDNGKKWNLFCTGLKYKKTPPAKETPWNKPSIKHIIARTQFFPGIPWRNINWE